MVEVTTNWQQNPEALAKHELRIILAWLVWKNHVPRPFWRTSRVNASIFIVRLHKYLQL